MKYRPIHFATSFSAYISTSLPSTNSVSDGTFSVSAVLVRSKKMTFATPFRADFMALILSTSVVSSFRLSGSRGTNPKVRSAGEKPLMPSVLLQTVTDINSDCSAFVCGESVRNFSQFFLR